jgi:hypothetical protein
VSEIDPEAIKRRADDKLAALRAAIRDGLDSGPAEPFDIKAILAEAIAGIKGKARANGLTDAAVDAELEAWHTAQNPNPSKTS